jgi:hypothetical protein
MKDSMTQPPLEESNVLVLSPPHERQPEDISTFNEPAPGAGLSPAIMARITGLIVVGVIGAAVLISQLVKSPQNSPAPPVKATMVTAVPEPVVQTIPTPIALTQTIPTPVAVEPPVKIQSEDTLVVALATGEVGTIKYVVTASYIGQDSKQSVIDRVTIANVIQDSLSQTSSQQLATETQIVRKKIAASLPPSITSINLQASKELLDGYRKQKQAAIKQVKPVVKIQPIKAKTIKK